MEPTTITAMVRVRRWRWWPFAHKYVPAPRVPWGEMFVVKREDLGPEVMQVMAAGVEGLIVKRGGA